MIKQIKTAALSLVLSTMLLTSYSSYARSIHTAWDTLLKNNVVSINRGHSTEVDYAAMGDDHKALTRYLNSLSAISEAEFNDWSKPKQLAFLINAYNAWTVELILTKYPDLESIKDLGSFFSSPWSKEFIPLLGKTRSLDEIEHELIRGSGKYNDPRIHFAVNCASIGCPALREEAYTGEKLEAQLDEQTKRFLSDMTRNVVQQNELQLSSIFKWYGDDFKMGFRGAKSLNEFILQYPNAIKLIPAQQKALKIDKMKIKFLDYDWKLNAAM
ncbi:DUF547 domain-containing protein [Pseudoalteromonas sp. MMG010]|uniref:DUF547 domain-containing protein n=1 Tax=Pseudoalteromonas sp. MMG010 TaxID=2822685 RepID=UPI001FFD2AB6|nr:DUF547 domain-containing protein [Pseudoalteromonas sp. MMG010]